MNINELRNAPPQTKQYLDAQLLSIGLAKTVNTPRGQRNVQELQVVDQQDVQEKIAYWYDTDKPDFAMPQQQLNQWLRWVVKTKPNGQYLNISGYPEKAATLPQQQPPQEQDFHQPSQLNPQTQAVIDAHCPPRQAAEQIMDHLAGPPVNQTYTPPPQTPPPTQEDYAAKERKENIGKCMHGYVQVRLGVTQPTDFYADKGQIAVLWQIATMIVDGTGQVEEEPSF